MIYTYMTQLIKKVNLKNQNNYLCFWQYRLNNCRESRIIERFQLLFQD